MRGCTSAEEQRHWISLIAKGGLYTNEDIAKLLAIHQQVLALGVQLACSITVNVLLLCKCKSIL